MPEVCAHIKSSIYFDDKNKAGFCPYYDAAPAAENLDGIWLDIDALEEQRKKYILNPPAQCRKCRLFEPEQKHKKLPHIQKLYLACWHECYVNCLYCKSPKCEDLAAAGHYDVFPYIQELMDRGLVTPKTQVIFECGDACVHPEFDKIMFYFLNNEFKHIQINTSAQRLCSSIEEGISANTAEVIVSMDSACQFVYKWIKQQDKFGRAVLNIKRYLFHQMPENTNVILKYMIVEGITDNKKEPLDLFIAASDLGIKKLIFDIEPDFYEKSLKSISPHIKELIKFLKDLAWYNLYNIEFAPRLKALNLKAERQAAKKKKPGRKHNKEKAH